MSRKLSTTELVHRALAEAAGPLSMESLIAYVRLHHPNPPQRPKSTIQTAISNSGALIPLYNGTYGFLPNAIQDCAFRQPLIQAYMDVGRIWWDEEARNALWPWLRASGPRRNDRPVTVHLADGPSVTFQLDTLFPGGWVSTAEPAFWQWLEGYYAEPGDALIVRVQAGFQRRYTVEFAPNLGRDEESVQRRNRELGDQTREYLLRRKTYAPMEQIVTTLIVEGVFRDPTPPDLIAQVLNDDERFVEVALRVYRLAEKMDAWDWEQAAAYQELAVHVHSMFEQLPDDGQRILRLLAAGQIDHAMQAIVEAGIAPDEDLLLPTPGLGGSAARFLPDLSPDYWDEAHLDEPPFHLPRRRDLKAWAQTVYLLRVKYSWIKGVWRDIEIRGDQTLEDLHLAIQQAYKFDNDHLYSFFMSGRAWDAKSEIAAPFDDGGWATPDAFLGGLDLHPKQKFLYLFDYGDEHRFDITVRKITAAVRGIRYPRLVLEQGKAPLQYPGE